MDIARDLHELCETLSREVEETNDKIRASGGKITSSDMDYIDKLTHALKSVKAVEAMSEDGYSGYYPHMDYRRSYAPRRDSRGRYSGGYSRDGGMIDELRGLMQDAPDERTRQEFKRFIDKLENM